MRTLEEIKRDLSTAIPAEAVHPADQGRGIYGDYITAQYAMQQANAIFDVDGIRDVEFISDFHIELPKPGEVFGDWVFITTLKLWFRTAELNDFSRPGRGIGVAFCPFNSQTRSYEPVKPQQIDTAAKSALSDAIKNALMRTGQALGAELYFDERTAQVLGYEVESVRTTGRSAEEPHETDLASMVCQYGWGKEKKFVGMTLQQIYEHEDGVGAMEWCSKLDDPGGFSKYMAEYYKQRMAQVGEGLAPDKSTVVLWTGETKDADGLVNWTTLSTNASFQQMLAEKMNPDGDIPNFHANHPRVKNHFKRHFHIDSGQSLTWMMLQALYTYCKEGFEKAAFAYPQYYAGDRAPTEQSLQVEQVQDLSSGPMIAVGAGSRKQNMPAAFQARLSKAGVEAPDDLLWSIIGEDAVEGWGPLHVELMDKIVKAIEIGTADPTNIALLVGMWTFGLTQFGDY